MYSPRLPWEVIERVTDLSAGRPNTLCNLALTCRHLRRPSHLAMFGRVQLESHDRVFAFVAFLLANPELKPFVHTLVVTPAAFGPSLLYILPNLSSIKCADKSRLGEPEDEDTDEEPEDEMPNIFDRTHPRGVRARATLVMHRAGLACFGQLGVHIRTLRLNSVSFPTSLAFAQVLSAFAGLTSLVCEGVEITAAGSEAPLELTTRRLSERMKLEELTIDSRSLSHRGVDGRGACPGVLLFHPRLAPSTVESLTIEVSRLDPLPLQSDWCQLQRLVLQFSDKASVDDVAAFLEGFPNTPRLREVLIEWRGWSRTRIVEDLSRNVNESNFKKLGHALLRFPKPRVTFVVVGPEDAHTPRELSFWARELGKHLPGLLAHGGAVTAECKEPA